MKTFDTTTVGDVMHEGVVTCDVDEPLTSVARTMLQRRIHCVVVWHEPATASDPQLWGVVSDLDLVKVAATEDVGADSQRQRSDPGAHGHAGGDASASGPLMAEHEVTHLVVVDAETSRPVGVISIRRRQVVSDRSLVPAV